MHYLGETGTVTRHHRTLEYNPLTAIVGESSFRPVPKQIRALQQDPLGLALAGPSVRKRVGYRRQPAGSCRRPDVAAASAAAAAAGGASKPEDVRPFTSHTL
jgi:hypothetical protein